MNMDQKTAKRLLNTKQKEIKEQVQSLVQQRILYSSSEQLYRELIKSLVPFYIPISKSNRANYDATRYVRNQCKQSILKKPQGRPPIFNDQEAMKYLENKIKNKTQQINKQCHEKTITRTLKRAINLSKNEPNKKSKGVYEIPNYNLSIDQLEEDIDLVQFGYRPDVLNATNVIKPYSCYGCGNHIGTTQGKNCMMVYCANPQTSRRKKNQLQWHENCLIIVNWNEYGICGCCAYYLHAIEHAFDTGNAFISDISDIIDAKVLGHAKINDEVLGIFSGYKYGANNEYYFILSEKSLYTDKKYLKYKDKYIIWNNKYRLPHNRDEFISKTLYITGYENEKYPGLHLKYIQNQCNTLIPKWISLSNFDPVEEICEEIVNYVCHRQYDAASKTGFKEIDDKPGSYYYNSKISISFLNYSYKVIINKLIKNLLDHPKNINNKEFDKYRKKEYTLFEIDEKWDENGDNGHLLELIRKYTVELNKLLKYISNTYKEFHIFSKIEFKPDDMGAFLYYLVAQSLHIDTDTLMTLLDAILGNSSLFMINAAVNGKDVEYDAKTDRYSVTYPEELVPKMICLDNTGRPCQNGRAKQKHLEINKGDCVIAIPPDVAMHSHQAHDICGPTIVFTNRGISQTIKDNVESVTDLMDKLKVDIE